MIRGFAYGLGVVLGAFVALALVIVAGAYFVPTSVVLVLLVALVGYWIVSQARRDLTPSPDPLEVAWAETTHVGRRSLPPVPPARRRAVRS